MNQKTIWMLTVVLALVMVAGAVMFARRQPSISLMTPPVAVLVPEATQPSLVNETPVAMPAPVPVASVTPVPAPVATSAPEAVILDEISVDLSRVAGTLKMSSPDIPASHSNELPRYPLDLTCYRKNASPALSWQGAPEGTAAYILVLERRAVNEKALWSWIMLDVPAGSRGMRGNVSVENLSSGQGILARNAYDNAAYAGPCDPKGTYLYVLRLFALDKALGLPATATTVDIVAAMDGHVIDAAEIRAQHYLQK